MGRRYIGKMSADTIVALSTPPGVAALAVIRLSGPESGAIVDRLVTTPMGRTAPATPFTGRWHARVGPSTTWW